MCVEQPPENEYDIIQLVHRFNDALNAADIEGMMRCMAPDCVFENTYPPPDGARFEGQSAVRLFWEDFFHGSNRAQIIIEEIFALYDRCVMLWRYEWINPLGHPGHIRGVDVYRLRGGLIAEKLSYVKG
jgi:ketosteroid isomerase-like protein